MSDEQIETEPYPHTEPRSEGAPHVHHSLDEWASHGLPPVICSGREKLTC